jgi:hypothetical protein
MRIVYMNTLQLCILKIKLELIMLCYATTTTLCFSGMTRMEKSLCNGRVMVVGFDQDEADDFHECRVWMGKENQNQKSFLIYIFDPDTNLVNVMPISEIEQVELNKALFEVVADMKDGRRFLFREETDADISEFYTIVSIASESSSAGSSPSRLSAERRKSSMKALFGSFGPAQDEPTEEADTKPDTA